MAINAGTVYINVIANTNAFKAQMLGLGKSLVGTGAAFTRAGSLMTRGITIPLGIAAIAATKLALDYRAAFTKIAAVTDASQTQIHQWRDSVLDLAGKTAQAPEELANALYFLASAGLDNAEVFPALQASAKAAAAGLGEVDQIARLTANAMNAYGKQGLKAIEITDTLVAAVKLGTAEPDEFARAMGRILPIASKAGVGFDELAASLASVSNIGLNVNEGVTAMRGLLQALIAPGTQASEAMKSLGISTTEMRESLKTEGILETVRQIEQLARAKFGEGWIDTVRKIIPNIRALTGAMALTAQEGENVDKVFEGVTNATGEMNSAFERTKKGPQFQLDQLLTKLKIAGIQIGNKLIPILLDVGKTIVDLADSFNRLSPEVKDMIVKWGLIAIVAGPVIRIFGGILTVVGLLTRGIAHLVGIIPAAAKAISALTGATSAAAAGSQLTLFGGEAAATGAAAGSAAIATAAALVVGSIVYIKLAYDNMNESVDKNVELLRQGEISADDLTRANEQLATSANTAASATNTQGLSAKFASGAINGARNEIDRNNEAITRFNVGIRNLFESFGIGTGRADQLADMLTRVGNTTEKQRHKIAQLIGSFEAFGKHVKQSTLNLVEDYLSIGQVGQAIALLKQEYKKATQEVIKGAKATAEHVRESREADHVQRLLAGGVRNAQQAIERAGNAAKTGSEKVKGLGDKLREVGKQRPKPKITMDTSAAQGQLSALEGRLQELTSRPYNVNVHLTTTGGSTGFHLLDMLEQAIRDITDEDWEANINVKGEGLFEGGIRGVHQTVNHATRLFEKLGTVVENVVSAIKSAVGEKLPKAYLESAKALQQMVRDKSRDLERLLNKAERVFDRIKDKAREFRDAIVEGFTDAGELISGAIDFKDLQKQLEDAISAVEPDQDLIKSLTEQLEAGGGDLSGFLQKQIAAAKEMAAKLTELSDLGLSPALLAELASQGTDALPLIDALLSGGSGLVEQFNAAQEAINEFANDTSKQLTADNFGKQLNRAAERVANLGDRIQQFNQRVGNEIAKLVNAIQAEKVASKIDQFMAALTRALRQLGVSVPGMASGGIVTKPTLLVAGEAGPEAIVPLSQIKSYGGGGGQSGGPMEIFGTLDTPMGPAMIRGIVRGEMAGQIGYQDRMNRAGRFANP